MLIEELEKTLRESVDKALEKGVVLSRRGWYTRKMNNKLCLMGALGVALDLEQYDSDFGVQIGQHLGLGELELLALEYGFCWPGKTHTLTEQYQPLIDLGNKIGLAYCEAPGSVLSSDGSPPR